MSEDPASDFDNFNQHDADTQRALLALGVKQLLKGQADLRTSQTAMQDELNDIRALFDGAKAVVSIVKWVGAAAAGIVGFWTVLAPYFHIGGPHK